MQEWQRRIADYGTKRGLLQALSDSAQAMCAPFWWSLKNEGDERAHILNNGTICYVNTGTREIGVSANHVLEKYFGHIAEYGDVAVECQFGSSTISPEKRVIAQCEDWDLATIDVPNVFVTAGGDVPIAVEI
jgi:hypothetical protein